MASNRSELRSSFSTRSVQSKDSVWSPMPEHLINFQIDDEISPSRATEEVDDVKFQKNIKMWTCDLCEMTFKTKAMLIYHKAAFCVGEIGDSMLETEKTEVLEEPDHDNLQQLKLSDVHDEKANDTAKITKVC